MYERYDLHGYEREAGGKPGLIPIKLTVEQVKALFHAATSDEEEGLVAMGFAPMGDALAEDVLPSERTLVIEAYDSEGWILVGYGWNEDGAGVWLATDGGWHYQPGETGYYPWRD